MAKETDDERLERLARLMDKVSVKLSELSDALEEFAEDDELRDQRRKQLMETFGIDPVTQEFPMWTRRKGDDNGDRND